MTKPNARDTPGAPTVDTTVDRVAPTPSAAIGGRNRTKYHAEPITPPSHTIRNVNRSGRTRSIAIRTRARMPPAYRRISGGAAIAVEIHSRKGISSAAIRRNPTRHFHRIAPPTSLPIVFRPKAQVDLDVSQSSKVRPIEEVHGCVFDPNEVLVEEGPDESRPDIVHGHATAEFVERGHDDRLLRQPRVSFVLS